MLYTVYLAPTCAKTLRTGSSACSNIISRGGISNPRASRSREPYLPTPPRVAGSPSHILARLPRRYNPVLGEFFRCRYDYPNGTQGFYIAEQGANHSLPTLPKLNNPFIPDLLFFCSFASSTYIRFLLRFAGK